MALMHTLVDRFVTLDTTTKWAFSFGTPTLSSGRVNLSCVNTYEGLYSGTSYDLTDSSLTVEMVSIPTGGGNSRHTSIVAEINSSNRIEFGFIGDQLYFREIVAGSITTWETLTYNATNHRWWRFAHVTGTGLTAYVSPDGIAWTAVGTAHTTTLNITALYASIFCGYFGTESSPPDAVIDNVNSVPVAASAGTATVSVTASQPSFPRLAPAGAVTASVTANKPGMAALSPVVSVTSVASSPKAGAGARANSQIITGMYGGYGNITGISGSDANEVLLGRKMDLATDYLPHDAWTDFNATTMATFQLDPWATWRSTHPGSKFVYGIPLLTDDNVGDFAGVAAGTYDSHFTVAGNALVDAGHEDAIIMLGWEPNNATIGPWQATSNPSGYISAFQHVVTLLRGISGNEFTFSLASAGGTSGSIDSFDDYYPGDSYVDYVGLNIYDVHWQTPGDTHEQRWTFNKTRAMGIDDHTAFAASHNKPLVCHEWGLYAPGDDFAGGGDDPYFIQQMAQYFRDENVYFQSYFDFDWGGGSLADFPNGQLEYVSLFSAPSMARARAYDAAIDRKLASVSATAFGATIPGDRQAHPSPVSVLPFVANQPISDIRVNPVPIGS